MSKDIVKALVTKKFSEAKELVFQSLYAKTALAMDDARMGVASSVFNAPADQDEGFELDEDDRNRQNNIDTQLGRKEWSANRTREERAAASFPSRKIQNNVYRTLGRDKRKGMDSQTREIIHRDNRGVSGKAGAK